MLSGHSRRRPHSERVNYSHPCLDEITRVLTQEFATVHPGEFVERCVRQAFRCFEGARIEAYLPVLVHKIARDELSRHASGNSPTDSLKHPL